MTRQYNPLQMNKKAGTPKGDFRPRPIPRDPEPETPKDSSAPASVVSSPDVPVDSTPRRMGDPAPAGSASSSSTSPTPPSSPPIPQPSTQTVNLPPQLSDAPVSAASAVKAPPTPGESGTQPS